MRRSGKGKQYFDAFRERLSAIEGAEERIADEQDRIAASWHRWVLAAIWSAAFATLVICTLVTFAIIRIVVQPLKDLAD